MKVTMEYIAAIAGVSKSTVSRVVNGNTKGVGEATRKRVENLIEQFQYHPNLLSRGPMEYKTKSIGLLIPDITNPFFSELIRSVETYASENGYTIILGNTDFSLEKEHVYISTFIAKKVDGIILVSASDNFGKDHHINDTKLPFVLLDRKVDGIKYGAAVYVDNEYAVFQATEFLINHGNKNIAFISGPKNISTSIERIQGYKTALMHYKLPFFDKLVHYGDYTFNSGYNLVLELYNNKIVFDSIIAANDAMAIGALKALKELNFKVPSQIELIGFDNIPFAEMTEPPLTTIMQPVNEVGRIAAQLLFDLIDNKELPSNCYRLHPKLIVRGSTRED